MNEHVFDALFQAAVCQIAEEELVNIVVPSQHRHTFSQKHERKMKVILGHHKRQGWRHKAASATKRIAVVLLVIIAISFGSLMTVEAVRNEVIRAVTQWFEQFTDVGFIGGDMSTSSEEIDLRHSGAMLPGYVPEGFESVALERDEFSVFALYEDTEGRVVWFNQMWQEEKDTISIDNEQHISKIVSIHGYEGVLAVSNQPDIDSTIIIWNDGTFTYMISGDINENPVIAMAESLLEIK